MITSEKRKELAEKLRNISADDKDKIIFRTRFGLDDGTYRSLEQTGKVFGMTREGVRLIIQKLQRLIEA